MAVETIRVEGLRGVLQTLEQLPPAMVSTRGGPVRRALRKAALVVRDQMQAEVQRIIDTPNITGEGRVVPSKTLGNLKQSVKPYIRSRKLNAKGEAYIVAPPTSGQYYPTSRTGGKTISAYTVGLLLEKGTEHRAPMPWARPAYEKTHLKVPGVFVREIRADFERIKNRLAKQNGVA